LDQESGAGGENAGAALSQLFRTAVEGGCQDQTLGLRPQLRKALCALPAHAGTLTNAMAQRALDHSLPGNGQKGVVGVVEIPAQNVARADIVLSNFAWNAPQNDAITAYAMGPGGGRQIFNGRAVAVFVHNNNGRWILLRIEKPTGNWENLNIAAP
jgi:hypothetical protein